MLGIKEIREPAKEPQKDEKRTVTDSKPDGKVPEKTGINGKGKMKVETVPKMSDAQHRALMNLSRRRGISVDELQKMSPETYGIPIESHPVV